MNQLDSRRFQKVKKRLQVNILTKCVNSKYPDSFNSKPLVSYKVKGIFGLDISLVY